MTDRALLLVAVRTDHGPEEVKRRIETILAAMATYEHSPDTVAAVWAKPVDELLASDLEKLAHFMTWERVRDLNVGDVVSLAALEHARLRLREQAPTHSDQGGEE